MKIPFTTEQFFGVFEKYNLAVFPLQIVFILFGIIALFLIDSKYSIINKLIGIYLGLLWIWTGLVYHIFFFSKINKAAFLFGAVFIAQGLLFLVSAFSKNKPTFIFESKTRNYPGYFFILFGLIIYPLIGYLIEADLVRTISAGLPCPSTILTFGFLLLTSSRLPKYLLIIPSLWAIVGLSAATRFGVYQDFMLIIAAVTADIILLKETIKPKSINNLVK